MREGQRGVRAPATTLRICHAQVLVTTILTVPLAFLAVRLRRLCLPAGFDLEEVSISKKHDTPASSATGATGGSTAGEGGAITARDAMGNVDGVEVEGGREKRMCVIVTELLTAPGLITAAGLFLDAAPPAFDTLSPDAAHDDPSAGLLDAVSAGGGDGGDNVFDVSMLWVHEDEPFTLPTDMSQSRLLATIPPLAVAMDRAEYIKVWLGWGGTGVGAVMW